MNYEELIGKLQDELDYQRALVVCDVRLCQGLEEAISGLRKVANHLERLEREYEHPSTQDARDDPNA